jgi:hypothetical protein
MTNKEMLRMVAYALDQAQGSVGGGGELSVFVWELTKLLSIQNERVLLNELRGRVEEGMRPFYLSGNDYYDEEVGK